MRSRWWLLLDGSAELPREIVGNKAHGINVMRHGLPVPRRRDYAGLTFNGRAFNVKVPAGHLTCGEPPGATA